MPLSLIPVRRADAGVNWPLVTVLIAGLLCVTVLPEARMFLMFIDAVGLDFFLLLLSLQGRAYYAMIRDQLVITTWRKLRSSGPLPFDFLVFPTLNVARDYPFLSVCSATAIVMSIAFMFVLAPVLLAS